MVAVGDVIGFWLIVFGAMAITVGCIAAYRKEEKR